MPSRHFRSGGSTDAAVPLVWAHSEYVKLHRSAADGKVFDLVEPVHDRYVGHKGERKAIEVWKFNRQVQTVEAGTILRIQANSPFLLHWTKDDWRHSTDTPSRTTAMGIDYADIAVPNSAVPLQFTFLFVDEDRWEGKDYDVQVRAPAQRGGKSDCE
jgi:glucoamylase